MESKKPSARWRLINLGRKLSQHNYTKNLVSNAIPCHKHFQNSNFTVVSSSSYYTTVKLRQRANVRRNSEKPKE